MRIRHAFLYGVVIFIQVSELRLISCDDIQNPHMDMQAMDRCHRIGQTRPVHVYRLATANSVEVCWWKTHIYLSYHSCAFWFYQGHRMVPVFKVLVHGEC